MAIQLKAQSINVWANTAGVNAMYTYPTGYSGKSVRKVRSYSNKNEFVSRLRECPENRLSKYKNPADQPSETRRIA